MTRGRVVSRVAVTVALLGFVTMAALVPATTSGYTATITNSTNTAATAQYFTCTGAQVADRANAYFQYYLNEASGATTAADSSVAANPGTYRGLMTTSTTAPIACPRDTGGAYVLNGTTSYVSTTRTFANPRTFSVEVWFKTTVAGGKLIGFGNAQTGASGQYDRHLFIDTTGKLAFGSYSGVVQVISTPAAVNNGVWHYAVGTMSAATGMNLYLDGVLVASNAAFTAPENYTGYWRVGYDNVNGWPTAAAPYFFNGQLRYAAAYSVVLSAAQIQNHWLAGK